MFRETVGKLILVVVRSFWAIQNPYFVFCSNIYNLFWCLGPFSEIDLMRSFEIQLFLGIFTAAVWALPTGILRRMSLACRACENSCQSPPESKPKKACSVHAKPTTERVTIRAPAPQKSMNLSDNPQLKWITSHSVSPTQRSSIFRPVPVCWALPL